MMRPGFAVVLALMIGTLPGCFTPDAARTTGLFGGHLPFSGPVGEDVVTLSVAQVERPVGDRTLNRDIWELVNEQVLDSDQRDVLAANGFRVGRVGGSPPPALHDLICSERSCRTKPLGIQLRAGNPHTVVLGAVRAQCQFQLDRDGQKVDVDLDKALCQLQVVPRLTGDGRVTLRITPFIKHGDLKQKPIPVRTAEGERRWDMQVAQDEETYSWLAWELTVDVNDTVVIGCCPDAATTLGERTFIETEATKSVQRLVVLRVSRLLADPTAKMESSPEGVPLAIQAGLPGGE
jgi:hypothetical protein